MDRDDAVLAADGDLVVRRLTGPDDLAAAVAFLDAAEGSAGAPLVDEAERHRLEAAADERPDAARPWVPLVAERAGRRVGYAGAVLPTPDEPEAGGHPADEAAAHADVAVHRDQEGSERVLELLLTVVTEVARQGSAASVQAWLRAATDDEIAVAAAAGYRVERRLAVLGRPLTAGIDPDPPPDGVTVRAYLPDADDEAVAGVLAAAYAGTPEAGWDLAAFRARRELDWFRPDDLLVAEGPDGRLLGLHWLKRRGARVGEVYNLAIHPAGQGRGLGEVLLTAGLAHLAATGCDEVLLWVDRANEPAVRLYTSRGFGPRWEDVALARSTDPGGSVHEPSGPRPSR